MSCCLIQSSKDSSFSQGLNVDYKIKVRYDGKMHAESTDVSMNTMCSDISNSHNWPMDEITCDIQLGVMNEKITLLPAENNFFTVILS